MDRILLNAPLFLLIYVRCFALLMTLPLFSMRTTPRVAKLALAGYMAFFLIGTTDMPEYGRFIAGDGVFSLQYVLLLLGEGLIGVIMGFYITIIFAAFSTAGQFMAFQMGIGAASAYDSLSQIENPIMGQFFNLVAMLVFMQTQWFQRLFLGGLVTSFRSLSALSIVAAREHVVKFLLQGLTNLFADALVIALPVIGIMALITISTGFLTKAAPQMNLLSEGFPIMLLVAFYIFVLLMPGLIDFFVRSFSKGFADLERFFYSVGGGVS